MYKLLLVTNQEEVKEAYTAIPDMNRLMFDPIALAETPGDAIDFLQHPGADAIAMDLGEEEAAALNRHLTEHYPFLPIARTHRRGDGLRNELSLLREVLDQLHGDFSDYDYNPGLTMARLQNEALHRLLEERIGSRDELVSRLLLSRSPIVVGRPCLLFEFDLPDGAHFLGSRWHHGFDRLDLSLRANFFGQLEGPLAFTTALISPLRMRVLACATDDITDRELDHLSAQAQRQVLAAAEQVKHFMDLDLVCTQFKVLAQLDDLIPTKT